ncbi:S41 family peptidase [Dysgonomonas sp. 25]|uniref:S41 family peptidase n=1 Tax=Dysgonomonas sp. 25 TaxID=2302933 RepID=UPI0013D55A8C|nr:S41 family peptidase [Dysgonomonas sp. 25]NDV69476.1 hypothetical protein [Dysgonomonas sp. 25]
MKVKNLIFLSIIFTALAFTACGDSDDDKKPTPPVDTDEVFNNKWIYERMSEVYLWNDQLTSSPNYDKDPEAFFYGLLYKYAGKNTPADGDRFSWIEADESKQKATMGENDLGFEYIPAYITSDLTRIGFFVLYTKPNTDADGKLKRGHIIYKVNGEFITGTNFNTILNNKSSFTFSAIDMATSASSDITVSITPNYAENPVFISKVVYQSGGHKVGYLMYNQFKRGEGNGYEYDVALANALKGLKSQNITDLVLDLRYNPGGYVTSAVNLASALVPAGNESAIFAINEYNPTYQTSLIADHGAENILYDRFVSKVYKTNESIPKMNLGRVYIIATENSASASELIINGLKPYTTVKQIGTTTRGKDKGSITEESTDSRIKWKLQPLVVRIKNAQGEGNYINGISPDPALTIDEWDYTFGELGNPATEPLLAKAIEDITGTVPAGRIAQKSTLSFTPIKGVKISQKTGREQMIVDLEKFDAPK